MNATPPQRRSRFNLWAIVGLIIIVACVSKGWTWCQVNWIRQRHDYLNSLSFEDGISVQASDKASAPGMLRFYGEDGIVEFAVWETVDGAKLEELKALFPEAKISYTAARAVNMSDVSQ